MTKDPEAPRGEVTIPARNFTLTLAERLAGMAGAPAYMSRLRQIEDHEENVLAAIRAILAKVDRPIDPAALPVRVKGRIAEMNRLIDNHNKYYPIEASLPIDPQTSRLMLWGKPWTPMPHVTAEALIAKAREGSAERG